MTDQERYERQVTRIVEQYKANMKYYRVLGVEKGGLVLLEQVHTRQQITMPVEEVLDLCINRCSDFALSNPSELAKFVSNKESFYRNNENNIYALLEIDEKDFEDISNIALQVKNKRGSTDSIFVSKLLAVKVEHYPIITNFENFKGALLKVIPLIDRINVGKTIVSSLHETFSYIYDVGEIQSNNADKFKFTVREKKGSETADTTLFFTVTKNALKITAKRNNNKLEQTYSFNSFKSFDITYVTKICAKIFYDICNALGFNPNRFYLSPRALYNELKSDKYSLKIIKHNFTDQKFGGCNIAFKVKYKDVVFDGFAAFDYKLDKNTLGKSFSDFCDIAMAMDDLYNLKGKYKLACKETKLTDSKSFSWYSDLTTAIEDMCGDISVRYNQETFKRLLDRYLVEEGEFKEVGNHYEYKSTSGPNCIAKIQVQNKACRLHLEALGKVVDKLINFGAEPINYKTVRSYVDDLNNFNWHLRNSGERPSRKVKEA